MPKTCSECGSTQDVVLSLKQKEDALLAAQALRRSFTWAWSKEGFDHWSGVFERLIEIANGREL